MSTRFGTYVGHSAKSIVLETRLESSNIAWHVNSLPNCHFSEVQVLHLLPNGSDSTYCSQGGPGTSNASIRKQYAYLFSTTRRASLSNYVYVIFSWIIYFLILATTYFQCNYVTLFSLELEGKRNVKLRTFVFHQFSCTYIIFLLPSSRMFQSFS